MEKMTVRLPFRAVLLLAGLTATVEAQRYVPPPPPLTTLPPCPADKKLAKKEIKNNQCDPPTCPHRRTRPLRRHPTPPPLPSASRSPAMRRPPRQAPPHRPSPIRETPRQPHPSNRQAREQQPDAPFSGTYPTRPGDPPAASGQKPADTPASNKFPYPRRPGSGSNSD